MSCFKSNAQSSANPLVKIFDPISDPIGIQTSDGTIQYFLEIKDLVRSIKTRFPEVAQVESIQLKTIKTQQYLVFKCRPLNNAETGIYMALLTQKDQQGKIFMAKETNICSGCAECSFAAEGGCICNEKAPPDNPSWQGKCTHTISDAIGLARITLETQN
jgi:hypothetical protein